MKNPAEFSKKEIEIIEGVRSLAAGGSDLTKIKVQDIAAAADMGKGTLYEYFKSKDEILLATILYCACSELDRMEELICSCTDFESLHLNSMRYISELIEERVASYMLLVGAMRQATADTKEIIGGQSALRMQFERLYILFDRAYKIASESHFMRPDIDEKYFVFVIKSIYMNYASEKMQLTAGQRGCFETGFPNALEDNAQLEECTGRLLRSALS